MFHFDEEGGIEFLWRLGAVVNDHYREGQFAAYTYEAACRKLRMFARKQLGARAVYDIHELPNFVDVYYDDEDPEHKEGFYY